LPSERRSRGREASHLLRAEIHRQQASGNTRLDFCLCRLSEAQEKFKAVWKHDFLPQMYADGRGRSRGKPAAPTAMTNLLQRFLKSHAASATHGMCRRSGNSDPIRVHLCSSAAKTARVRARVLHLTREGGKRSWATLDVMPTAIKNDRWHESFSGRRRRLCFHGAIRRAIQTAEIVGTVNDFGGWHQQWVERRTSSILARAR
jgi:hypothetical protein